MTAPIVDALTECPICGPELVDGSFCIRHGDLDTAWSGYHAGAASQAARIEALVREVAELTKCVTCGWRKHEHAPDCPQAAIDAATGGKVEGERSTGGAKEDGVATRTEPDSTEPMAASGPPTPPPAVAPEPHEFKIGTRGNRYQCDVCGLLYAEHPLPPDAAPPAAEPRIARVAATITPEELQAWLTERAENCARLGKIAPDPLAWAEDECYFRAALRATKGAG